MKYSVLLMMLMLVRMAAAWPEPGTDTTIVTGFSSEPNAHMTPTIRTELPIGVGEFYILQYKPKDPNYPLTITYQDYPDCAVVTNNGTPEARCVLTPMEEGLLTLQVIIAHPNRCGGESTWFEEFRVEVCNPNRNYDFTAHRQFAFTFILRAYERTVGI